MSGYVYLAIAICAEVIATTSMKALAGFSRPLPLLLVICGYSLSFWMLALVVNSVSKCSATRCQFSLKSSSGLFAKEGARLPFKFGSGLCACAELAAELRMFAVLLPLAVWASVD